MTSRRSFLRRLVGAAALVAAAPVVAPVLDQIACREPAPVPPSVPPEMFKIYLGQEALDDLMETDRPTFSAIKRISDKMRRDFGVERF